MAHDLDNLDDVPEVDERLASWMLSYEQAGSTGTSVAALSDLETQIPAAAQPQLGRVKACLNLLAELRSSIAFPQMPEIAFGKSSLSDAEIHRIGQFEIVETLGSGGFGIVYRAWDPLMRREVAIKVPRPEALASGDMQRRFEQEARAAAKLDHPYIVQVLEAGTDGHVPYIASVFYRAVTLSAWLKEQTRSIAPRAAAELIAKLADALNHAHLRGVLHRDIKPSNVLLVPVDPTTSDTMLSRLALSEYTPKVADFGLAKLADGDTDQTRTGMVLGTLLYMAPEQAEGRIRDISQQTDVYALGAVLYELLTGRPPLSGESDRGTLHQILTQEPVSPSRLSREIPSDLDAICLKCLEKQSSDRYTTAHELAADLERFLSGQPTKVRPLGPLQRLTKWSRRRPAIAALSSVLCAALLTILVGSLVYSSRLRHTLAEVSAQRAVADQAVQDTRLTLYAADMQRAQQAWRHNHVAQVVQFLAAHEPQPGERDRREFSWYYLRDLCHQESATLQGHEGDVFAIAASPDGSLWASGGKDATVRLWDVATRTSLAVLTGHTDEVTDVAFSPSGDALASASEDGTIRIWPIGGKGEPRVIQACADRLFDLCYSPDGRLIASCGYEKPLRVWNAATLELVTELSGHAAHLEAVTFSHDGQTLVAADDLGFAYAWDVSDWQLKREPGFVFQEQYFSLATSPVDDLIAGGGRMRRIPLWRAEGELLEQSSELRDEHLEWIQALAFSPRERLLASADKVGVIQLWNLDTQARHTVLGHADQVWSLAWSPDGKVLASAGGSGVIRLWDGSTRHDGSIAYPPIESHINKLFYTADGKRLIASTRDDLVAQFDVEQVAIREVVPHISDWPTTLTVSHHGAFEIRWVEGNRLGIDDLDTQTTHLIDNPVGYLPNSDLALSNDGQLVAWDDRKATVTVVRVPTGERFTLDCLASVESLRFSPDNNHLAICTTLGTLLWKCSTKQLERELPPSSWLVYSPDGTLLVTMQSTNILVYEATSGRLCQKFVSRPSRIHFMAVSRDNKTLAIINRLGNIVTLLDMRSGQELVAFKVEARELCGVAFSPQGDRLAVGGSDEDGKGRVWEWKIDR